MQRRMIVLAVCLAGCASSTELRLPSAPTLDATVYYAAGGSHGFSGSRGWWGRGFSINDNVIPPDTAPLILLVAYADAVASSDPARPAFGGITLMWAGEQYATFPQGAGSARFGGTAGLISVRASFEGIGATADSGMATVEPLGGDYAHVAFDFWFAGNRVVGVAELPLQQP